MSYDELIKWGKRNYNRGGDVFVECWSESDFDEYVAECGPMTEATAATLAGIYEGVSVMYGGI